MPNPIYALHLLFFAEARVGGYLYLYVPKRSLDGPF